MSVGWRLFTLLGLACLGACCDFPTSICDQCTDPSTEVCVTAVVDYCATEGWDDAACASVSVPCPFTSTGTTPCDDPNCGVGGDTQACASAITAYCAAGDDAGCDLITTTSCGFPEDVCVACSDPSSSACGTAVTGYCDSVGWEDPLCQGVSVSCPFDTASGTPCDAETCDTGLASYNTNACVASIAEHCTDFPADSGCSTFPGYVRIADSVTSFPLDVTTSVPSFSGEAAVGGCINIASGSSTYVFANDRQSTGSQRCLSLFVVGSQDKLGVFYGGHSDSSTPVTKYSAAHSSSLTGGWHSVAVSVTSTEVTFFVDGAVLTTYSVNGEVATCPSGLAYVGARPPSPGFYAANGEISEVTVWNRAITTADLSGFTCG